LPTTIWTPAQDVDVAHSRVVPSATPVIERVNLVRDLDTSWGMRPLSLPKQSGSPQHISRARCYVAAPDPRPSSDRSSPYAPSNGGPSARHPCEDSYCVA
jgi:hypothetical protein